MEKWHEYDKISEETKYCNLMESLKKNDKIEDYVVKTLAEKTENYTLCKIWIFDP